MWYSRKYDMSPMPNSIFFKGGYAIHGTGYIKWLGTPASHGCVRLHPDNAKTLFSLVKDNGIASMQVEITQ
jgi:lipoprotein-anchoring transpeptidase ErfK/SrfK